jgi:hypothetical protein
MLQLYLHSLILLRGVVLSGSSTGTNLTLPNVLVPPGTQFKILPLKFLQLQIYRLLISQILALNSLRDRLCGLVVRVSGYRSRGPGFDSRPYQIFREVGGLEQGSLSLVRTIEEVLE